MNEPAHKHRRHHRQRLTPPTPEPADPPGRTTVIEHRLETQTMLSPCAANNKPASATKDPSSKRTAPPHRSHQICCSQEVPPHMARTTVDTNGILPCQEAFLVDAPTPQASPYRWIQAKASISPVESQLVEDRPTGINSRVIVFGCPGWESVRRRTLTFGTTKGSEREAD